jgi:hypothetical protein
MRVDEREIERERKENALVVSLAGLGTLAHDAVDSLGEVIQVIRVQAGHGDTAVLSLYKECLLVTHSEIEFIAR